MEFPLSLHVHLIRYRFLNKANEFFSEFLASTLLIFCIFALKDGSNSGGIRGDGNWFPLVSDHIPTNIWNEAVEVSSQA